MRLGRYIRLSWMIFSYSATMALCYFTGWQVHRDSDAAVAYVVLAATWMALAWHLDEDQDGCEHACDNCDNCPCCHAVEIKGLFIQTGPGDECTNEEEDQL